jgi:hypothetical protein
VLKCRQRSCLMKAQVIESERVREREREREGDRRRQKETEGDRRGRTRGSTIN